MAPVEPKQEPSRFYYYVGPHSANTDEEATYIEIEYCTKKKGDGTLDTDTPDNYKLVKIALGNDPPGTERRKLQLNRNSAYEISIRLVKKKSGQSVQTRNNCPHMRKFTLG